MRQLQISFPNLFLTLLFVVLFFSGCDKPVPSRELAKAKYNLTKAESVKADQYAPVEYKEAIELLTKAIDVVAEKPDKALPAIELANNKAIEAFNKSIEKRAEELINELASQDKELSLKRANDFFPAEYSSYKEMTSKTQNFFDEKNFVASYENAIDTKLNGEKIVSQLKRLQNEAEQSIFEAETSIAEFEQANALIYEPAPKSSLE